MEKLAASWVNKAMRGSHPHLESILERLYPVIKEQAHSNPIVHMGIRLELADGHVKDASFALQAGEESQMDQAPEALSEAGSVEGSEGSVGVPKIDRNPS